MNPFLVQSYHRLLNGLPFCLFSQLHIVTNQYLLNFGNSYLFQVSARPLKFIITSQCADKDNWSLIPTASVQTRALFISGPMALCLALNFNYVVTGQPLIERPTRTFIGRTSTLLSHFTLRTFFFPIEPRSLLLFDLNWLCQTQIATWLFCGSLISAFAVVGFYGSPRSFRVVSWWNYFHHILKHRGWAWFY